MSQHEGVSVQELGRSDVEREADHGDRDASNLQTDSRQVDSKRKRAAVLTGSAILQLPSWGKPFMNLGIFL